MDCVEKKTNMVCVLLSRIVTEGEKREVWRLTVENVSTAMKPEEKDREQNMYKDVSSSSSAFLKNCRAINDHIQMMGRL